MTSTNNSPQSSPPPSPTPSNASSRSNSGTGKKINFNPTGAKKIRADKIKTLETDITGYIDEIEEYKTDAAAFREKIADNAERLDAFVDSSERDGAEIDALKARIADLESALLQQKQKSAKTTKAKKYKGVRIKKADMPLYDKKALDTAMPAGWNEPKENGNYFTYGIPLRDDGSLVDTGYIYNGLRWTTEEFDTAVAECEKRADIKSLHYDKGYWHAKTGDIIRGKGGEGGATMRVFIKGDTYDDKLAKASQKDSEHGGEQNLKDTLRRWGDIFASMTRMEQGDYFTNSVRFPKATAFEEMEADIADESGEDISGGQPTASDSDSD